MPEHPSMHALAVALAAVLGTQPQPSACSSGTCPRGAPHAEAAAPEPFVPVPRGPRLIVLTSRSCAGCARGDEALGAAEQRCARTGVVVSRHDVDAPEAQPLVRRYRPAVVPTFVFLDEHGQERARLEGVQPQQRIEDELARLVHAVCALVPRPAAAKAGPGRG